MNVFQKIQRYLLLHHPLLWNTRILPVLCMAGSVNVLLFVFFYAVGSSRDTDGDTYYLWAAFLSLCSLIALVVYLIYLLRFNYFKNFGRLRPFDFAWQFLLLFVTLGSISAWPFVPKVAAHMAIGGRYFAHEMRADLEEAYVLAYQLEYSRADPPYRKMRIEVVDSLETETEDGVNNLLQVPSADAIDTSRFVSLEKQADGTFTGYEKLYVVCGYYPYNLYTMDSLSDKIYASLPATSPEDREAKLARLNEIFGKYIRNYDGTPYVASGSFYGTPAMSDIEYSPAQSRVCDKYRLDDLGLAMENIDTLILDHDDWRIHVRVWFYLTFYTTLLLLIFRYMTVRTFLWTLLFSFLLFVFTVIFSLIAGMEESGVLALLSFYYLVFFGFAVAVFFSPSRNVFMGIGLNLSFFCLQLAPLVLVSFLHETVDRDIREQTVIYLERFGLFLVAVSLLFFHSRLFYRWYSLPEE